MWKNKSKEKTLRNAFVTVNSTEEGNAPVRENRDDHSPYEQFKNDINTQSFLST